MSDRDSNLGTFFMGLIVGGIAGAIATVLYAPKSGEETRKVLRDKKEEFSEKANVTIDEAYKQAEIVAKDTKGKFNDLANATKSYADDLAKKGKDFVETGNDKLKDSMDKISDDADIEIPTN